MSDPSGLPRRQFPPLPSWIAVLGLIGLMALPWWFGATEIP